MNERSASLLLCNNLIMGHSSITLRIADALNGRAVFLAIGRSMVPESAVFQETMAAYSCGSHDPSRHLIEYRSCRDSLPEV